MFVPSWDDEDEDEDEGRTVPPPAAWVRVPPAPKAELVEVEPLEPEPLDVEPEPVDVEPELIEPELIEPELIEPKPEPNAELVDQPELIEPELIEPKPEPNAELVDQPELIEPEPELVDVEPEPMRDEIEPEPEPERDEADPAPTLDVGPGSVVDDRRGAVRTAPGAGRRAASRVRALVELVLLAVVAGVLLASAIGLTVAVVAFALRQFAKG